MWISYSKGLRLSSNTIYSTALNKFSNFISSAIFGYLIFEEQVNLTRLVLGLFVLFAGISLLSAQQQEKHVQNQVPSDKQE